MERFSRVTKKLFAGMLLLAAVVSPLRANEPGWTPAQRLEQGDIVIEAKVLGLRTLDWKGKHESLYWVEATVEVGKVIKGEGRISKFYILSSDDPEGMCPILAAPKEGASYLFYLTVRDLEGARRPRLMMASNAVEIGKEEGKR